MKTWNSQQSLISLLSTLKSFIQPNSSLSLSISVFFQILIIKSELRYFTLITNVTSWDETLPVSQGIASTVICKGHYQTEHPPPLPTPLSTPTHPHIPKIFSHPPPFTQNNTPSTPTHHHPPKIMLHTPKLTITLTQNNASLTVSHT